MEVGISNSHTGFFSSLSPVTPTQASFPHEGCQLWVGKYLETLGVEPGVGGIWGGEEPQWNIMLCSQPSKTAIFSRGTDLFSLEMSYNSRGSPGPTWGLASLTPTQASFPHLGP